MLSLNVFPRSGPTLFGFFEPVGPSSRNVFVTSCVKVVTLGTCGLFVFPII